MSEPTKAVFLSYAREDADAARRIADALRSQGMEVWFDQAELRGGEAWDAKIKKQIRECALFLAVVSAHTQERAEGYFRREWKQAVERTSDMAAGVAFLVPVVIDDTAEVQALVPEEFMRVQWMRLAGALPTPEFVAQVKNLLGAGRRRPTLAPMDAALTANPIRTRPPMSPLPPLPPKPPAPVVEEAPPPRKSRRSPSILVRLILVILTAAAAAWHFFLRPAEPAAPPPAVPSPSSLLPARPEPAERAPSNPPQVDSKSIAVLPFTNMSEDKENTAFFADGMHEDILTSLAFIKGLRVTSRTSVMQYRNTTKPISQIAAELKVAYVLEGSVRRAGNKVRVTGQLIRTATDEHMWASNYDRDISDVFAIQAELSKSIAGALQAVLSPEAKALLERRPTENPAAYDVYLRARALENSGSFFDARDMAVLMRRAVELDPKFAAAWAALGQAEAFVYFKSVQTPAQLALAQTAIERAVQLAPDDPAVVEGLGNYYYYGYRDYARATEQFLRLAQLRPNDAAVWARLGYVQRRQGRMPEALANFRRASDLEPLSPVYETDVIYTLIGCRLYAEAESRGRKFGQTHPGHLYGLALLGQAEFAARGSTATMRALGALSVPQSDRAEHRYVLLQNARAAAQWPEASRLDREQRYFDHDGDTPHFLQDVVAAAVLAEAGDPAAARARAGEALTAMKTLLGEQPLNAQLWAALGLAHGLLGAREDAIRSAAQARELLPESKDANTGPAISALCASALAYAGEKDRALAEFERLLRVPFGTNAVLDRGIWSGSWQPLRDDPRFQALLNDPKNNLPLF